MSTRMRSHEADLAPAPPARWMERLHDGPLQEAIALQMQARQDPRMAEFSAGLDVLVSSLRSVLADDLVVEHEVNLTKAIHGLARDCPWALVSVEDRLPEGFALSRAPSRLALRVAAEALANLRHAQALRATVLLEVVEGALRITVHDDGVGFDTEAALAPRSGHLGLHALRSSLVAAGGRLHLRSIPGRASHIEAEVPLGALGTVSSVSHAAHLRLIA